MSKKILVVFHNLNIEGAPTMLVKAVKVLLDADFLIEALSLEGGAYEEELGRMGIPLNICETTVSPMAEFDSYVKQFDLIIANTVITYQLIARYNNTVPIMWYIHEGKTIQTLFSNNIKGLDFLLKGKTNIVVVSEYVRDWLENEYGIKNIAVLHNYIDLEDKADFLNGTVRKEGEKVRFTYLGSIDPHKGLDILLEANHRLSDREYVHINYAGNILDQRFYDTIISRYKEDNIQYWGLVSGEEKKRLFQETDVFVVPSRDESCSLVVLEAFAAGKPVIISNQVGAKYLLTDRCGWIFDIDHIDELSGILKSIGSFKYDLSSYGVEARKQYEKHVNYKEYKEELLTLVEKYSNKKDVHRFSRCTDCGACRQICPVFAISQKENSEGFLYPWVDYDKCIQCGKCVDVCPVVNPVYQNLSEPKCYAAYTNDEIRMDRSSSGGVFTVFANSVLSRGGYVSGVVFDDNFKACHIVSDNPEDVYRMRGSKYVQSDTGQVFSEIKQLLTQGKTVLFTGVSCQVAGLKAYLGKEYENLFCIDILCHGVSSPGVFRKYLNESFDMETVQDIQFKSKKFGGWRKPYLCVETEKDVILQFLEDNEYASAFLHNVINRNCCAECQFQKLPRQGDITIGDFWGIEDCDPGLDDNKGTSVLLVNSEKGQKLLEKCKKEFLVLKEERVADAIKKNPNIISPSIPHPHRNKFFEYNKRFSVCKSTDKILRGKCDVILMNYWYAKNYGAMLTCYALYRVLEKENIDVSLMNYIPERFRSLYEGSFAWLFAEQYMEKTKECYTFDDLVTLNDCAETFIVGSDQVWNYNIYQEHGGSIFQLDFTKPNKRRIACAVSFGGDSWNAPKYETDKFAELIKDFHAVSVREETGKTLLNDRFGIDAEVIGDPVFALRADEWMKLAGEKRLCVNKYFTYYVLAGGHADTKVPWIQDVMDIMETKTEIVPLGLEFGKNYTVEEWLNYVANAEFVVTDSFHAVCFSIIFNKPFLYLLKNTELYPRLENVFRHYKINPIVVTEDNYNEILAERSLFCTDFEYANQQIQRDAGFFKEWLLQALHIDIKPVHNEWVRDIMGRLYEEEKKNVQMQQEIRNLVEQNAQLKNKADIMEEAYSVVTNSTIWKTTKPLRKVLDRMKH